MSPRDVHILAPAKVNLTLRILDRRPDGYHNLETLFQAVDFCDELWLTRTDAVGHVELSVEGPKGDPVDVGPVEDNLVTRALQLFWGETQAGFGVSVRLLKRIPAGAGLGGGSSDAGAALRAVNFLAGSPVPEARLVEMGGALGADVAFFAQTRGLAAGTGRGDALQPLSALPPRTLLVGCPPVHVSTAAAYGALARGRSALGGELPPSVLSDAPPAEWAAVRGLAVNDFEAGVAADHSEIREALDALAGAGVEMPLLSGSGAAVFGLVGEDDDPGGVLQRVAARAPGTQWMLAPTLPGLPAPERLP